MRGRSDEGARRETRGEGGDGGGGRWMGKEERGVFACFPGGDGYSAGQLSGSGVPFPGAGIFAATTRGEEDVQECTKQRYDAAEEERGGEEPPSAGAPAPAGEVGGARGEGEADGPRAPAFAHRESEADQGVCPGVSRAD